MTWFWSFSAVLFTLWDDPGKNEKKKKTPNQTGNEWKSQFLVSFFLPFWIFFFLLGNRFEDVGFFSLYFFFPYCATTKNGVAGRGQPKENETYHWRVKFFTLQNEWGVSIIKENWDFSKANELLKLCYLRRELFRYWPTWPVDEWKKKLTSYILLN